MLVAASVGPLVTFWNFEKKRDGGLQYKRKQDLSQTSKQLCYGTSTIR